MSILDCFNVLGMDRDKTILQVLELNLALLLNGVDLLFEDGYFLKELFAVFLMLGGLTFDLGKQFLDLVILQSNHLPQTVEFDRKYFLLVLLIMLEIFDVKVYHFLKLVLHLLHLLILLLDVIIVQLLSFLKDAF